MYINLCQHHYILNFQAKSIDLATKFSRDFDALHNVIVKSFKYCFNLLEKPKGHL